MSIAETLRTSTLRMLLLCAAVGLIESPVAVADSASGLSDVPAIEVRGEASLRVSVDQIEFSISVVSEGGDAARTLAENSSKVAAVHKALEAAGLAAADIQTGQFQLQPQWVPAPQNPSPTWRPTIIGFVVEHQISVRTRKLSLAGSALSAASSAGANRIGELRFSLADAASAHAEAIARATRAALQDADAIAAAAGLKRGRILSLTLEPSIVGPQPVQFEMRAMAGADNAQVPVTAGTVEVRAAVQLRVAIGG